MHVSLKKMTRAFGILAILWHRFASRCFVSKTSLWNQITSICDFLVQHYPPFYHSMACYEHFKVLHITVGGDVLSNLFLPHCIKSNKFISSAWQNTLATLNLSKLTGHHIYIFMTKRTIQSTILNSTQA